MLRAYKTVLTDTPVDHLLSAPDVVYILRVGQVVIDAESRNTTEEKENQMLVRVDILDNTGTDEPFAGLVLSTH
jgi:hypothetical protein